MAGKSIKIECGGVTKTYGLDPVGGRANYTPTDQDLEKIAGMINKGVAQGGIRLIDKASGDTYDLYISDDKLMMEKVESEG